MPRAPEFVVYYRTGGYRTFKWHRVGETYPHVDAARNKAEELRKMGYPAHYESKQTLDDIGLPDTFE